MYQTVFSGWVMYGDRSLLGRVVYSDDSDDDDEDECRPADVVANNYVETECGDDFDLDDCTPDSEVALASDCCYVTALSFTLAVRINSICVHLKVATILRCSALQG